MRVEGAMRVEGKVAVVVGAGQTPGETIGNGRATAVLLAREGATVLGVDRHAASVSETVSFIEAQGGTGSALVADITDEEACRRIADEVVARYGRVDILVNNVGIGTGDAGATKLTEEAWDRIHDVNLKGMWLTCKHVLPLLRAQGSGAIVNISSAAAVCSVGFLAYKTSKAGVNALTHQLAMTSAKRGVRVNAIMPGLMDTPMAIEGIAAATGTDRDELRRQRDALVPLGGKMGTAWDVAHAVLFLVSDEAAFITGAVLPVDGGQHARIG
jgi:NAD(P)-dependent dehydrogenase (short-subunit alcohol dehydrogenase family)